MFWDCNINSHNSVLSHAQHRNNISSKDSKLVYLFHISFTSATWLIIIKCARSEYLKNNELTEELALILLPILSWSSFEIEVPFKLHPIKHTFNRIADSISFPSLSPIFLLSRFDSTNLLIKNFLFYLEDL